MTIAATAQPRFEMGRVAKRTFSVIGHNLVTFFLLSLIPGIALGVTTWFSASFPDRATAISEFDITALVWFAVAGLIYLFSLFVLQAAVTHGTVADLNGKRASFGNCLSTGIRNFVSLLLIALLVGFGVLVGMIFLIVPGIILAVAWLVAVPARVVEHTNVFDSISRSNNLTRGHRWAIFGLIIAYVLLQMVIGMFFGVFIGLSALSSPEGLSAATTATRSIPYIASSAVVAMITAIISSAGVASVYYELRVLKDGIGPEALAAVFD